LAIAEIHLFDSVPDMVNAGLSEQQIQVVQRMRDAYTIWRDHPAKQAKDIIRHLRAAYGIESSQAYNDLKLVQFLIGSFEQNSKDWHRWRFNQRNEETRRLAILSKNFSAAARCDSDYAKFNWLDQPDVERVAWEKIAVQPFFPTSDPSVINLKPIPNLQKRIAELEKKYTDELDAVEIDYIDVTNSDDIYNTDKENADASYQ